MRRSLVGETRQGKYHGEIRLLYSTDHGRVPIRQTIMKFADARIVAFARSEAHDQL
jgi:hypothetical protein